MFPRSRASGGPNFRAYTAAFVLQRREAADWDRGRRFGRAPWTKQPHRSLGSTANCQLATRAVLLRVLPPFDGGLPLFFPFGDIHRHANYAKKLAVIVERGTPTRLQPNYPAVGT